MTGARRGAWAGRGAAAALGLVVALSACTDLPSSVDGLTRPEIRFTLLPEGDVGDTLVAVVEVVDEQGNVLAEPPIVWDLDWRLGPVVSEGTHSVSVLATHAGTFSFRAVVPPVHPFRESGVTVKATVRNHLSRFDFEISGELVLGALREGRSVPVVAVDHRGRPIEEPDFTIDRRGDGATTSHPDGSALFVRAQENGVDTIIASYPDCYGRCADTLVVRVQQVPATLEAELTGSIRSLGDTVSLGATVRDAMGYVIGGYAAEWSLAEPADTMLARLLPGEPARLVALDNGTADVAVAAAGLTDTLSVRIEQRIARILLEHPDSVLPLGAVDTMRVLGAQDGRGNPIPGDWLLTPTWEAYYDRDVLSIAPIEGGFAAEITAISPGWDISVVWVDACGPSFCDARGVGYTITVPEAP